ALTTNVYWKFLKANGIDKELERVFKKFNPKDIKSLQETGKKSRGLILRGKMPEDLERGILQAHQKLEEMYGRDVRVAVRTSGVCEDMPKASFAGQFESYLNVRKEDLIRIIKRCIASTFSDRAIAYRYDKKVDQLKFGLSIGIIKMVRSDLASSGIMFSLDTETGFKNVVLINSIWGLGEMIVKGRITPDEFYVFKPTLNGKGLDGRTYRPIIKKKLGRKTVKYVYAKDGGIKEAKVVGSQQLKFSLTDNEILTLAKWAVIIEEHYSKKFGKWTPQDMEWAKDGETGELFIVQSRPETVHVHSEGAARVYEEYKLETSKKPILTGIAVGERIGRGKVHIIEDVSKIKEFKEGEVLVTKMTDPDWTSIMGMASAIVTDEGGKTCHAAIISRELGIPCIVGAGKATKVLKNGQSVTVDCSNGLNGRVWEGNISYKVKKYNLEKIPKLKTKIMVNIGAPEAAFKTSFLPNGGVGLAREEFIIAQNIKVHPLALIHFDKIKDKRIKKKIEEIAVEYKNDKKEFFVRKLAEGVSQIAAAFYPKKVIVRFSDFKTNEYRQLLGGELFEPLEDNPMLGWRGASRYYDPKFESAFALEVKAIKIARQEFGLKNIAVMVPFCRTVEEGKKVIKLIEKYGLKQYKDGLNIYVMCEIPSNVVLVDEFLDIFDGMSIGSNDLTQLTLGLDRDNGRIAYIGNERDKAVKEQIAKVIKACRRRKKYVGICGQAPSDYFDFAEFIMKLGIESMSLNADTIIKTILKLTKKK
ncbi:MAG TPA: phosphoenolpyruvate synthase, partial [Candidatus Parcubacteria bacterium]|nr:phosphoenolpyruvate synthase [Candidatus Parcubacteria bacterium]